MKMSELDMDLEEIRRVMDHQPTPEELLEQRISQLYRECEDLFVLAANQETVGQFKGNWRELDQAATRLQWVATAVEASVPAQLRIVKNG
jgi:hypothetical protein